MKKPQTLTMIKPRGAFQYAEGFYVLLVLAFTLLIVAICEPCPEYGVKEQVEYAECGFERENPDTDFRNGLGDDVSFVYKSDNGMAPVNIANICPQSNLFCFLSTLPGYFSQGSNAKSSSLEVSGFQSNISWLSDSGSFKVYGGRTISCSLRHQDGSNESRSHHTKRFTQNDIAFCRGPLHDPKTQNFKSKEHSATVKSGFLDSSLLHVEVSPPLLDWGQKYLYFPSSASVTVRNTHKDRFLNIYELYSTSSQFYPCNFSEISLAPGEVVSICFAFLPRSLGLLSAQIVLQTSYGGFLIHAKGLAVESPYRIEPLVGLDVSPNGMWRKNLSLSNPFNETISVEELTAWISVSSGNSSSLTEATCSIKNIEDSSDFRLLRVKEWSDVRSNEIDLPIMAIRPHRNWEVGPGKTEAIVELDFSYRSEGRVFGGFFMQVSSSSRKKIDAIMVPLDAEWSGTSASDESSNSASVSLQLLMQCDTSETVGIALSVRNDAPYLLSVVKVSEVGGNAKHLNIRYIEGLILFPGTTTQVAVVTYTSMAIEKAGLLPETRKINKNCKLLILTNDSRSSQTEIPCRDVVSLCSRHNLDSSIGYRQQSEEVDDDNMRTKNTDSNIPSPSHLKALNTAKADDLVLRNWKSQATASDISVLDHHVVVFPTVPVGSHCSQWITVKNPSQQPVVMQLILNSAEIIDKCRELDEFLVISSPSSLVGNKSVAPTSYGFSLAENAVTEAFVHPYGRASLGPIFFQPSNRCGWKSSALIRNNLTGVEWLYLQGIGGSFSMIVLEEAEPVQTLNFKLKLPAPLNFSSPDMYHMVDRSYACSQLSSKLLHAKNTGDLPLEVQRIEVSGTECGLDGFLVHTCKGFALEPGESKKLIISYQTDLSAATLHRDLELTLTTGVLVIPMKASVSMHMFNFCKRSMFWTQSIFPVFLAASILFVIVWCIIPHLAAFGLQGYLFKDGKDSSATVSHAGKSSHVHCSQKKGSKCASKMNGLLKSIGQEGLGSLSGIPEGHIDAQEPDLTLSHVNSVLGIRKQTTYFPDTQKEIISSLSVASNTEALNSSNMQEAVQAGNLTIKTGNKKRRRRRKKRNSGAGLAASFEVSSSQSGNSTPSSPLSPLMSLTPTRPWQLSSDRDQSFLARNLFAQVADLQFEKRPDSRPVSKANILEPESSVKYGSDNWCSPTHKKPAEPRKLPGKPVLLPSATFPSVGRAAPQLMYHPPVLASTPKIAAHAKAPGSKLHDQKAVKPQEKTGLEEKFTYDIWGDHLFGPPLTGQSRNVSKKQPHATENNSNSFFVRDLQTLMTNSQQKSVCLHSI